MRATARARAREREREEGARVCVGGGDRQVAKETETDIERERERETETERETGAYLDDGGVRVFVNFHAHAAARFERRAGPADVLRLAVPGTVELLRSCATEASQFGMRERVGEGASDRTGGEVTDRRSRRRTRRCRPCKGCRCRRLPRCRSCC